MAEICQVQSGLKATQTPPVPILHGQPPACARCVKHTGKKVQAMVSKSHNCQLNVSEPYWLHD